MPGAGQRIRVLLPGLDATVMDGGLYDWAWLGDVSTNDDPDDGTEHVDSVASRRPLMGYRGRKYVPSRPWVESRAFLTSEIYPACGFVHIGQHCDCLPSLVQVPLRYGKPVPTPARRPLDFLAVGRLPLRFSQKSCA